MENLKQKGSKAKNMFESLVREMNNSEKIQKIEKHINEVELPKWL